MSLRLICGRAGTGKSDFCLEEIKQNIECKEKIYIVTPEQYSFTEEKKLLEKLKTKSSIKAEVLSFNRMAYRVLLEVGGLNKETLSKSGRAMLIYDILEDKKNNLNFLGKSNKNIELVETLVTELKKHDVSVEILENVINNIEDRYLQEKLKDIIYIYQKEQEKLKGKYIEEDDKLTILANKLEESKLFENSIFYIDEFSGFTKQEYNIIEKLLKVAKQVNITITTDNLDMGTLREEDLFYESKQVADKLLYIARKNNIECEKTIFKEETHRFETEELKHLEKNLQALPYMQYEKEVKNLSIFLAKNPYSEVEHVAKEITKLVKFENYRYKDIVVITKEMENYSLLCKAIFNSYNIPVFLDEKKELSQNQFAKFLLSILEVYAKNWSYEAVIEYLKTEFVDIEKEELFEFENYTKKWGIKGSKWYKDEWNFGEQEEEEILKAKRMIELRNKLILPLNNLKEELLGTKTVEQINLKIYEFLINQNILEKITKKQKKLEEQGKLELAKEQELAWNIVMQVLEEMQVLFEKDKISFEKYREILKIGLSNVGLGKIPQMQDQVIVGDLDRTKISNIKATFILGMNDGVFPMVQRKEGFLNDEDRINLKTKGIELAKGTLENLYEDNFNIYKAFTMAKEKLFFSYPSSSLDGKSLRPSTYITKIKKIFKNIKEDSDLVEEKIELINENNAFEELIKQLRENKQDDIYYLLEDYFSKKEEWKPKLESVKNNLNKNIQPEKLNKENIEKLYQDTIVTSISKLEQYQSCPFSYYLKYDLKLKQNEEYKMKPIDTGTFMHEVIDSFFTICKEKNLNIKELEEIELEKIVEDIINQQLELSKYYIFNSSKKFEVLTNKLKRVVIKSMKYIIESLKNSDFEVFANELEFKNGKEYKPITLTLDDKRKVEITGKIDRVDIAKTNEGNYIRIIDYKSSVKNIDLNEVVAGLQIQLITYLDAMCKIEDVLPAGALYYNLIDPILKTDKMITKEQIEEEMKKKFKMNGLILADVNVIKKMDKTLDNGQSNMIPVYLDKEGNISKSKSNVVTKKQFEDLMKYTNKTIKEITKEMLKGEIKIEPYYEKKTKKTPCDYCEYKEICNFKEQTCNSYRYVSNNTKEEILEKIKDI